MKRFRLFWKYGRLDKRPKYHVAHISDISKALCDESTADMETNGREYQLPPPEASCIGCLRGVRKYWPERGALFYADD